VGIGEYLIEHARAAFALVGSRPEITDAQYVLKWLD
jgi:hypothetical protein